MFTKTILELRNEATLKLNEQFLEHLKMIMGLNPFCDKFEFLFKETRGQTIRNATKYFTEIETKKAFNDIIFHKLFREDPFFSNCEI